MEIFGLSNVVCCKRPVFDENKHEEICAHALNDFVLTKGHFSQLARLDVRIAGQKSVVYPSDGVIVANSNRINSLFVGSRRSNSLPRPPDVSILTPICAHSLETRPLIIPMGRYY